MCIKFEVDYGYLDIEANVKMLTDICTDNLMHIHSIHTWGAFHKHILHNSSLKLMQPRFTVS